MDPSLWLGSPRRAAKAVGRVITAWAAPPPVPAEVRAADEARQQRLFEALAVAIGGVCAAWAIGALSAGWAAVTSGLTGVMLAVAIAGVRQGRWTRAGAGGWLVAALWAVLSAVVFATGGLGLAAPFALVLVPMLAVLLVGPRAGLAWTGIILAQVAVLAVLHLGGFAFPHQVFEGGGRYVTGLAAVIALLSGAAILSHLRSRALVTDLAAARVTLDVTRRRARQAGQAKSRFLAGMSHELRTPMTGVLGMLDALRDEPLSGEQRETLEQAEVSARTLLDLINAIIDLSRAESRELQLESSPFDLRALVDARLDAIRPAASARRISVDVRFSTDAPEWVVGDESRVGQVLGVLLDNAVAYTEAGAISVAVEARTGIGASPAVRASARDRSGSAQPDEAPTTGVRLRVLDTGRGIAPERQSSIFDPFARGQAASPGGGGLGLAIGRRLARRMGGDLSVESTVGVGSSFALDLPLQRAEAPRPSVPPVSPEREAQVVVGMRVLVVDDNAVNRAVLDRMLRRLECEVTVAADGEAGVSAARAAPFDLVLMDVQMPGIDGLEAARRLRAAGVRTPIVALTASTAESDRARCLAVGMDGVLHKPLRRADLVATLLARVPRP